MRDDSSGGSETTIRPPTARKDAPHSAVTARNTERPGGDRRERLAEPALTPRSSARPRITSARARSPIVQHLDEKSGPPFVGVHQHDPGVRPTRHENQPGTPPPVPRSMTLSGRPPARLEHRDEPECMVDLVGDGMAPRNPSSSDRRSAGATVGSTCALNPSRSTLVILRSFSFIVCPLPHPPLPTESDRDAARLAPDAAGHRVDPGATVGLPRFRKARIRPGRSPRTGSARLHPNGSPRPRSH